MCRRNGVFEAPFLFVVSCAAADSSSNGSPPPKEATELWPDPLNPGKMLKLELSSTATSGFKGVTKATGKIWQARLLIDGELRHVKSSRRKRECAIALAQAKEMLAGEKRVKRERALLQMASPARRRQVGGPLLHACAGTR